MGHEAKAFVATKNLCYLVDFSTHTLGRIGDRPYTLELILTSVPSLFFDATRYLLWA